jgi:hypothetical protein
MSIGEILPLLIVLPKTLFSPDNPAEQSHRSQHTAVYNSTKEHFHERIELDYALVFEKTIVFLFFLFEQVILFTESRA